MKSYQSKITLNSKTIPGVSFTIRRMSDARRSALREAIASPIHAIRVAQAEVARIKDEPKPDTVVLQKLADDVDDATIAIKKAWLHFGFLSITGIEIDDKPATEDSIRVDGPLDLYTEIVDGIKYAATLSGKEEGESELPSISGAPEEVQSNNSSADTVESKPSTSTETADEPTPATTA